MATDGEFTNTIPNTSNNVEDDVAEERENFEYVERSLFILNQFMKDGYYAELAYTGDKLTSVTVKDSGGVTKGSATLTYSGDELQTEVWSINGKTLTYTYTWSSGKLIKTELAVT
jgi:hypothetical protein